MLTTRYKIGDLGKLSKMNEFLHRHGAENIA